jgi:hypothetical protein
MGVQGFSGFVSRLCARCEDVLACEWSSDALSLEVQQATHQRINTSMSSSTTRMCNRNKSVTQKVEYAATQCSSTILNHGWPLSRERCRNTDNAAVQCAVLTSGVGCPGDGEGDR